MRVAKIKLVWLLTLLLFLPLYLACSPAGVANLGSSTATVTTPLLSAANSTVTFNSVAGTLVHQVMSVQPSSGTISITSTQLAGAFSYSGGGGFPGTGGTCTTTINSSCTIAVDFTAVVAGNFSGSLTINYQAAGQAQSLKFTFTGVAQNPPLSVPTNAGAFGTFYSGNSPSQTITITNGGSSSVTGVTATASTSFSFTGGTYPGTGGTCGTTLAAATSCSVVISAALSLMSTITGALTLNYVYSGSTGSLPVTLSATSFQPTEQNELLVYNSSSTDSTTVYNYYMAHRPGISDANVLAVSIPVPGGQTIPGESMTTASLNSNLITPIVNWIAANPTKQIFYVVLFHGIPDRVSDGTKYSVAYSVAQSLKTATGSPISYSGATTHFTTTAYPNTLLVSYIATGTVASTEAYIDKLESIYVTMAHPSVILSASDAGSAGTTYYMDDQRNAAYASYPLAQNAQSAILSANPTASTVYAGQNASLLSNNANVSGYMFWGTHNLVSNYNYALDGSICFTGNSNWYVMTTVESYNGQWLQEQGSTYQGSFMDWFSSTAFCGTNYSHTPVGTVGNVEEPYISGMESGKFYSLWESGFLLIEAQWSGEMTPYFLPIGDPLVRK